MKIYLETANTQEIREAMSLGILDGVSTNSPLIAEMNQTYNLYEGVQELCRLVDLPICIGGLSVEEEAIVKEGKELAKIHQNIVIKCPLTLDGLKATRRLTAEGIRVNVTLCCSPAHALMAAKAGAWYVSSYFGCVDDMKATELDIIRQILLIFHHYGITTQVILAGVQDVQHVVGTAMVGSHICGVPFSVIQQLLTGRLVCTGINPL